VESEKVRASRIRVDCQKPQMLEADSMPVCHDVLMCTISM
jgi:hypothetical protein